MHPALADYLRKKALETAQGAASAEDMTPLLASLTTGALPGEEPELAAEEVPPPVSVAPPPQDSALQAQLAALGGMMESGRQAQLGAGLGRAGAKLGAAIAGVRPDVSGFESKVPQAGMAEGQSLVRQHLAKKAESQRAQLEADDRQRAALRQQLLERREAEMYPLQKRKLEQSLEPAQVDPLDAEVKRSQIEANKARAARSRQPPAARTPAVPVGISITKQVQDIAKGAEGLPTMKNDLATLAHYARMDDIPGVGKGTNFVPDFLTSDEGLKVRQAAAGVVNALLKKQSGSAVSEPEVKRKMQELGMGDGASEQNFRLGLQRLIEMVGAEYGASEAGFSPEAVEEYRRQGGVTSKDLPTYSATGGAPGGRITVTNGAETLEIDEADLAEAEADGFRRL